MGKKAGQAIKYTLSLALAGVLVWLAFRGVEWGSFVEGLRQTNWFWILLFFAASILALVFRALRWHTLVSPLDSSTRRLTVWDANNVGNLANIALPGAGEFVRCGYVAGKKATYDRVFGTVALERLFDIIAIVILFVLAISIGGGRFAGFFSENIWQPLSDRFSVSLWWFVAAAAALVAVLIWAAFHFRTRNKACGKIADALAGLAKGFMVFTTMPHKALFLILTAGIWMMYILMSYTVLLALPDLCTLTFTDAIFISAVGNIASVIPVPGSIGAYHYLVALTLSSLYGAEWNTGILFATLSHELHALVVIVLGIISYICITLRKKDETDHSQVL